MPDRSVPAEAVASFRARHGLTHEELDTLFGSASKGRASRRWHAEGAPRYVGILIAYADKFGLELMRKMVEYHQINDSL